MCNELKIHTESAANMLREMVSIPSYSYEEKERADFICTYLNKLGLKHQRVMNNIIIECSEPKSGFPNLMLNSHLDTVQPSGSYTFSPFNPPFSDSIVYGLGSNDAGASVVSMLQTYLYFREHKYPINVSLVYSAEEERSGSNGIDALSQYILSHFDFGIIGEPTSMKGAIAERGLLVIDAVAHGISGHAARNEGINAIEIAMKDIAIIKSYHFEKVSPSMGDIKRSVTQIEAGSQHNVIPDVCKYVIDIRTTEQYSNSEILQLLQAEVESQLVARSLTNKSSSTPQGHILLEALESSGIEQYVSPTTSDWMRLDLPAIKMGPGDSCRSHKADEYIKISEIEEGIRQYIHYIKTLSRLITDEKRQHDI